ncbi:MAG: GNAT family N-acetyltransferase [Rickettsiales bacterium]|jgi:GNAT superfamily N-acetyltransferase|nr:GNAT family N-acetyltransferase [Rickettsiales bacterium]
MVENIILRPAAAKDAAAIRELMSHEKQILSAGEVWDIKSIKIYIDNGLTFVAEIDGEIAGFIIAEHLLNGGAMLQLRIVDKKLRGRGIGAILFDYFEQALRDAGIGWMMSYARPDVARFHKSRGAYLCEGYTEVYKEIK